MSERWYMRQPSPRTCGKAPPLWVGFAIFVVVLVIGAVITVEESRVDALAMGQWDRDPKKPTQGKY
ncbi:hypothetical protein, partial [Burkholderia territorii]|uniref:hypothetical protein n=1 Tax=Burkholderia territorii TaxID=1503055 RepID=UPI000B3172E4